MNIPRLTIVLALALLLALATITLLAISWRRCKQVNAQLRADIASRKERPAIISHEIRTPLALINGAAELLAEGLAGPLTDQQRTFVTTITENTTQVINISENFLIDARLNSALPLERENVDVRAIVAQTARHMRRITNVPIHVDAAGGLLPIWADPGLIRQLVWNLVNNATRHAGPNATVTVRVRNAEGGGALLIVSDDGEGISVEDQEHMFDAFRTGSSRRPGTGIGMMVAQHIVQAHGGTILVDSLSMHGTAIHVILPSGFKEEQ
ncbi:His Kinase A (phospho-acceptor) domain-containing protein [Arcanobacterium phocae]|uniref:Sensor-like histidine kinase SenX3 n=1 Tax=Arcanobacterium phocae TaxID=131112 RepID=A0A1H2LGP4_9ACTO|nr:HAMP domain-containing sensor histidine kinase [Arcanobacterium phocae]SDU80079.1 His Kinase A (phospho-acceptor) domain-containing protein [Arcanobacterium phocae]